MSVFSPVDNRTPADARRKQLAAMIAQSSSQSSGRNNNLGQINNLNRRVPPGPPNFFGGGGHEGGPSGHPGPIPMGNSGEYETINNHFGKKSGIQNSIPDMGVGLSRPIDPAVSGSPEFTFPDQTPSSIQNKLGVIGGPNPSSLTASQAPGQAARGFGGPSGPPDAMPGPSPISSTPSPTVMPTSGSVSSPPATASNPWSSGAPFMGPSPVNYGNIIRNLFGGPPSPMGNFGNFGLGSSIGNYGRPGYV